MRGRVSVACAVAALVFAIAGDASAQRGGGGGSRGGVAVTRPAPAPNITQQRIWMDDRPDSTRARVRAACAADPSAEFCGRGQSTSQLRRRLWNACHGDNPPTACRRIFGDDDASYLRRRIWNACHSDDAAPGWCRRIFGQDPGNPHLRRRVWNACHDGELSPAFCRRVFGDA